jgi:hypothetical protein
LEWKPNFEKQTKLSTSITTAYQGLHFARLNHRPLRCNIINIPWGPVSISDKKDSKATHTMGETSNPLKGFTTRRVAASTGSAIIGHFTNFVSV